MEDKDYTCNMYMHLLNSQQFHKYDRERFSNKILSAVRL